MNPVRRIYNWMWARIAKATGYDKFIHDMCDPMIFRGSVVTREIEMNTRIQKDVARKLIELNR